MIVDYADNKDPVLLTNWMIFLYCFLHPSMRLESYPIDGLTHGLPDEKYVSGGVLKLHIRDAFSGVTTSCALSPNCR